MKHRFGRVVSSPAFGVVVLTPLLLTGAVAASPGRAGVPMSRIDRPSLLSFVPALIDATRGTSLQLGWEG